jgi:hypothetical protein
VLCIYEHIEPWRPAEVHLSFLCSLCPRRSIVPKSFSGKRGKPNRISFTTIHIARAILSWKDEETSYFLDAPPATETEPDGWFPETRKSFSRICVGDRYVWPDRDSKVWNRRKYEVWTKLSCAFYVLTERLRCCRAFHGVPLRTTRRCKVILLTK